jgi:hypothetical protein
VSGERSAVEVQVPENSPLRPATRARHIPRHSLAALAADQVPRSTIRFSRLRESSCRTPFRWSGRSRRTRCLPVPSPSAFWHTGSNRDRTPDFGIGWRSLLGFCCAGFASLEGSRTNSVPEREKPEQPRQDRAGQAALRVLRAGRRFSAS